MEQINQGQQEQREQIAAIDDSLWEDIDTRFHWSGDFRARLDHFSRDRYINANTTVNEKNDSLITWGLATIYPQSPFKVGLEYNHGGKYWIAMSPGHDDIYASKLATRGHVYEVYGTYDIPGELASRLGSAFFRLGFQALPL